MGKLEMAARTIRVLDPSWIHFCLGAHFSRVFGTKFAKTFGLNTFDRKDVYRGSFSNSSNSSNVNPKLTFGVFSEDDHLYRKESFKLGIPNISICSSSDSSMFVDICIPYREGTSLCLAMNFY